VEILILGVDIGGANIKVSALQTDNSLKLRSIKLHYPLWIEGIEGLSKAIKRAINLLSYDEIDYAALTMTAELSDVFKDKKDGVEKIVKAAMEALGNFKVITVKGSLLDPKDAIDCYMDVAAANWWAVGWFISQLREDGVVVDVGSTTTTITPVMRGEILSKGLNDVEKMSLGEIVYIGALRTPISSVTSMVPLNGGWCRVSSEYFANTGDVNLILGYITEEEYDIATPDKRGKSIEDCHNRLSRVVCGDGRMLTSLQTRLMAKFIYEKIVEKVFEGLTQVLSRFASQGCYLGTGFAAGLGDFIALDAIDRAGLEGIMLRDVIGRDNTIALTSTSLALYLAHKVGVDVEKWISLLR